MARPPQLERPDAHLLADRAPNPEEQLAAAEESTRRHRRLERVLGELDKHERELIEARYLQDPPVEVELLADAAGVTPAAVRNLEARALRKLIKLQELAGRGDILHQGRRLRRATIHAR